MGIEFNADEIFEMALQIERNGARFYQQAAEQGFDEGSKKKLNELAEMELEHERAFAEMRKQVSRGEAVSTAFDPYGEAGLYLKALADGYVFDSKLDLKRLVVGKSMSEILATAIDLEKDSIVFYLGMKDMVSERLGKGRLDEIINEEKAHITLLSNELASLE